MVVTRPIETRSIESNESVASLLITMGWRDALLVMIAVGSSHQAVDQYRPRFGTARVQGGGFLALRGGSITEPRESRVSLDDRLSLLLPDASGEDLAKLKKKKSTEAEAVALALKLVNQCDKRRLRTVRVCLDAAVAIFAALAMLASLAVPVGLLKSRQVLNVRKFVERTMGLHGAVCMRECTSLYKSLDADNAEHKKCYFNCLDERTSFLELRKLTGVLLAESIFPAIGAALEGAALFYGFFFAFALPLMVLVTRLIRIWHPVDFRQAMLEKMDQAPIFGYINRVNRILDGKKSLLSAFSDERSRPSPTPY